ncbi:SAM-dependent methyltransferase [Methanocella sp. CWC-04]|uniref:SAM-dependent methyltransferase n=2 Tax=Methanooceanicella nereidis TaxID=2052831 RepID=A0AAP2RCN7_9EURY|nr:SAM-dependent methyltransferase [Methanocella sp. CWC-04]
MAEGIAFNRFSESLKPEGERICYDPYAVRFISQDTLDFSRRNPDEARKRWERLNSSLPGVYNSIVARVRFFDDIVSSSVDEGIDQIVILGAGYDTRAYRIEGIKKGMKVFEVDHPVTQSVKTEKVMEIFGSPPDHVVYVPVDLEAEEPGLRLTEMGYDRACRTLFIMEGLVMYISPHAVERILSFMAKNSGAGSAVILDYFPQSLVDGTCDLEVGKNLRKYVEQQGEPIKFGIDDGSIENFLSQRGFSQVRNVTCDDYKRAYFHGKNENREVCSLFSFVYAMIG